MFEGKIERRCCTVERLKCLDYCRGIFDEANEDNPQSDDQQSQISLTVFIVLL